MRTDTRAQQALREHVTALAADRKLPEGRVLAQLIVGHIHESLEDGIETYAERWHLTVADLRELMAEYGLEGGQDV